MFDLGRVEADRPAGIDDAGRILTYGAISNATDWFAGLVEPRSLVMVLASNTLDFVQGCVALINNRAVPMLLDAASDDAMFRRYVAEYNPELAFVPEAKASTFVGFEQIARIGTYVLLSGPGRDRAALHPDLALLLPTSGSTGSPKLVRQSIRNLHANGEAIIEYLSITSEERSITSLPMHYTYGYSVLNSHLMAGATMLVTERSVVDKDFWTFFTNQRATSLAGVPFTYQMLQRIGFQRMELPSLRTMTQAGGKMTPSLVRSFADYSLDRGVAFFVMYGQTEATARMSYVPPEMARAKAGSIGRPIPGGEFFILGGDGELVTRAHQEGELGYRGPNVTMGYAECRKDLALGNQNDGRLLTGDVAYRDEDGFYYITGRRSRFVKVFGKRVSLDDVEQLACSVVAEAACLGVDDKIELFITDEASAAGVRSTLAELTGIHPTAFAVVVVSTIPRTTSGKIDYRQLSNEGAQMPGQNGGD